MLARPPGLAGDLSEAIRAIIVQEHLSPGARLPTEMQLAGRFGVSRAVVREAIAESRCAIEQARLLTLAAAAQLDAHGIRGAKDLIGMIKIVAPRMACEVIDRAMQIHGGGGLGEDHFLAEAGDGARALRLADGPDEVHRAALAKSMLQERHEDAARRPA